MRRSIILSAEAKSDIEGLKRYIKQELKMPDTATGYIKDLNSVMQKLIEYADAIGVNEYVQDTFGANARHILFKKMAIIFYLKNNKIYIHIITPGLLIY
jgi:plasmid stabilization system protein ParE